MRQYSVPSTVTIGARENVADAVFDNAEWFGSSVAFRRRAGTGWVDVTAAEFAEQVTAVAAGLIGAGLAAGDRVAIFSRTRYEWTLLDYAIATAGMVTVPIYETSAADQVSWILGDSGARAVIVESDPHRAIMDKVDGARLVEHRWQIDTGGIAEIAALGAGVGATEVRRRRCAVGSDDLATIVYTSGTTGRPKGCEITHRNLLAEIKIVAKVFPTMLVERGSVLLFLPLAHVFAKVVQCGAVQTRTVVGHTPHTTDLAAELADFRPTFLLAVPRVFEKIHDRARQRADAAGRGRVFDAAAGTAERWSRALDDGGPGLALRARHAVFDRLVYRRLRAAVGGACVGAVSGGAPLGERLGHFFRGVGVPVFEGYGLTETSGGVTVNTPDAARIGTVGRPVPGATVRIADDGEVLLRGEMVFRRYRTDPAATAEVLTEGWLHTGDIGELDDAGFLRLTGRKKDVIVTAGGKNVAPAVLEERLRAHPLVSHCMVVGEGRPFVGALITIDREALIGWRAEAGTVGGSPSADIADDPDLRAAISAAVASANSAVSQPEAIREFRILAGDFSADSGEMTPTMKVRREVVAARYAADIAAIYG